MFLDYFITVNIKMQLLISEFVDALKYNNRSVLNCICDFFNRFQNGFNYRRVLTSHSEKDFILHAICYCIYYWNFWSSTYSRKYSILLFPYLHQTAVHLAFMQFMQLVLILDSFYWIYLRKPILMDIEFFFRHEIEADLISLALLGLIG